MNQATQDKIVKLIHDADAIMDEIYGTLRDGADDEEARLIARRFCRMNDDQQAKFFVEVARVMGEWKAPSFGMGWQAQAIGNHLRTCECSTPAAREFIANVHYGMQDHKD
jgi:hypothetical protein